MRDDLLATRAKNAALRRELKDTTDRLLATKSAIDEQRRREEERREEEARAAEAVRAKREMMVRWARNRRKGSSFSSVAATIILFGVVTGAVASAVERPLAEVFLSGSTVDRGLVGAALIVGAIVSAIIGTALSGWLSNPDERR